MTEICYRCEKDAVVQFGGFPYCKMDFLVVSAMQGALRHDPPPGFPGAQPGTLDWQERTLARSEERGKENENS